MEKFLIFYAPFILVLITIGAAFFVSLKTDWIDHEQKK